MYVFDVGAGGGSSTSSTPRANQEEISTLKGTLNPDFIEDVGRRPERSEDEIAVDNSTGPTKGDIYVTNGEEGVTIYAASGERIGELNSAVQSEVPGAPSGKSFVVSPQTRRAMCTWACSPVT